MGQQQLLLIVLGVILVGVAVVLGIQYFGVGAEEGAKDELTSHNMIIGSNAQEWFKKPHAMGGGDGTFVGFTDNQWTGNLETRLANSTNGDFSILSEAQDNLVIEATPKANKGFQFTNVTTTVYLDSMVTVINATNN